MSANLNNTTTSQTVINKLKNGTNVFLTGGAGVGKSYTLNIVKQAFDNPIVLAPTGIAASHVKGETIHSFFGFPVDVEAGMRALSNSKKEELSAIYSKYDVLIIDEISMVNSHLLTWIDIRLKELSIDIPMLFVGDFYQLPPVGDNAKYAFESRFWREKGFETIELTKVYRTDDKKFSNVLNDLRLGKITKEATKLIEKLKDNEDSDDYTHLYSTNKKAFEHNKRMLSYIKEKMFVYELEDNFLASSDSQRKEFDFKKGILKSKFENKLFLKVGALVMYTINKKEDGIFNGKKGIITKLKGNSIFVDGKEVERETIEISSYKKITKDGKSEYEKVVLGTVVQFPIKLAYAITIHKSQGMSIDGLSVDLSYIFASGQAYVALSRAMNPKRTSLNIPYYNSLEETFYIDEKVAEFYNHDLGLS